MSDTIVKYHLLHQLKSADFHEGNEKKAIMSGTSNSCLAPVILDSVTVHNERTVE